MDMPCTHSQQDVANRLCIMIMSGLGVSFIGGDVCWLRFGCLEDGFSCLFVLRAPRTFSAPHLLLPRDRIQ